MLKQLIIFDIDGTLIEKINIEADIFLSAFIKAFRLNSSKTLSKNLNIENCETDLELFTTLFKSCFKKLPTQYEKSIFMQEYFKEYNQILLKNPHILIPKKQVKIFFKSLKNTFSPCLGIISGNFSSIGFLKINSLGIKNYFDFFGFSDLFPYKIQIFQNLVDEKKIFAKKQKITYIGDSFFDLQLAKELNINFIGIANDPHLTELGTHTTKITSDFDSVLSILEGD